MCARFVRAENQAVKRPFLVTQRLYKCMIAKISNLISLHFFRILYSLGNTLRHFRSITYIFVRYFFKLWLQVILLDDIVEHWSCSRECFLFRIYALLARDQPLKKVGGFNQKLQALPCLGFRLVGPRTHSCRLDKSYHCYNRPSVGIHLSRIKMALPDECTLEYG